MSPFNGGFQTCSTVRVRSEKYAAIKQLTAHFAALTAANLPGSKLPTFSES
ncbi:hypothetical protein L840_1168 [Mycobacterium sp. MAC_011194_8550]|nr:hypothetical protein L840_1168 [Mycobacterium sp. MAC_011194_8550]